MKRERDARREAQLEEKIGRIKEKEGDTGTTKYPRGRQQQQREERISAEIRPKHALALLDL